MTEGRGGAARFDHLQHLGPGAGEAPFAVEQGQDLPGRFSHIPLPRRCASCRLVALTLALQKFAGWRGDSTGKGNRHG